jgi:hypothetical protein
MYNLGSIMFVVSKESLLTFPYGLMLKLFHAVVAILEIQSAQNITWFINIHPILIFKQ